MEDRRVASQGAEEEPAREGWGGTSVSSPPVSFLRVIVSRTFFRSSLFCITDSADNATTCQSQCGTVRKVCCSMDVPA